MRNKEDWRIPLSELTFDEQCCLLSRQAEAALLARDSLTIREFACLMVGLDPLRLNEHENLYVRYVAQLEQLLQSEVLFDDVPF